MESIDIVTLKYLLEFLYPNSNYIKHEYVPLNDKINRTEITLLTTGYKYYYMSDDKISMDYLEKSNNIDNKEYYINITSADLVTAKWVPSSKNIHWISANRFMSQLISDFGHIISIMSINIKFCQCLVTNGMYGNICFDKGMVIIARNKSTNMPAIYYDNYEGLFYLESDNKCRRYTANDIIKLYDDKKYDYSILTN